MTRIAWQPGPAQLERSRLRRLLEAQGCQTLDELNARAERDPGWYWAAVERDLGVRWSRPYRAALDLSGGAPFARFFVDGRMNYVASAVHAQAERRPDAPAVCWEGEEEGNRGTWSFRELRNQVGRASNALRALGVGPGDRVGIFMPLTPECAVATLACSAIGAVFTPIFSGYGAEAVATRLADAEARLLITADGFYRRGRVVPMKAVADEAVARTPTVERVLVLRRVGAEVPWQPGRDVWWHDLVPDQPTEADLADTAGDDPYMLIYTSGTTGKPKGAVHVQAGFPIKAAHDLAYCFDVQADPDPQAGAPARSGDRVFWYSDLGWMMGPWLIAGVLILGGTIVLYDGSLDYPEPDRVWAIAERQRATVLGIAPTAVRGLMRQPVDLVRRHDLSSLRVLGSTGEPWNEGPWWWYFEEVGGRRCPIVNYSGGTEIAGGIVSGLTIAPCAPCAFNGPTPGMAADVVDERGQPVRGEVGELVIRQPWVGMTQGFWRDNERYLETYWSRWPGLWVHGDWARVDDDGFWYIQGRSDDTIKVAGKRVGPAEVESAAVGHAAVAEAAAVGVPDELKGESLVVFAVLRTGLAPSEELRAAIAARVVEALGPTLRPAVRFASEIPKTRNGKVLRRVVRGAHLGLESLGDLSSLESASAVEAIRHAS